MRHLKKWRKEDSCTMEVTTLTSSWQRGSNENGNGLLREFFPKGHDFAEVTDKQLADAIRLINNHPRKCLGWRSAHEAFMDQVLLLD